MIESIKQERNSKNCVAVVASMATGGTVEEFEEFTGECGVGYTDIDLFRFCLHKGFLVGFGFELSGGKEDFNCLTTKWDTKRSPAYLVCKSGNYEGAEHALYWDGKMIHDPSPYIENGKPISYYELLFWYPINKIIKGRKGDRGWV